jgi:group I intron endonuclease
MKQYIVYKTTNLINSKIYIGKACGKSITNDYLGSGLELTPDIEKYGKENFKRSIIDFPENRQDQNRKEIFWIAFYRKMFGRGFLYNISDGGEGGDILSTHPDREKIIAMRSDGRRKGKNHPMYGKCCPEKRRRKISESMMGKNKGKKRPDTSIMNKKRIGENNPMCGKHHSEESKRKSSESHKGKRFSEEHKQNLKLAWEKRRLAACKKNI